MGQQQLLLIILSVIVVGTAVVIGIKIFSANAEQANRDALVTNMKHVATLVQKYYKKPKMLFGGGNSYTGVDNSGIIPSGLVDNPNGVISMTVTDQEVTILGTGMETVDGNPIQSQMVIIPGSISNPQIIN